MVRCLILIAFFSCRALGQNVYYSDSLTKLLAKEKSNLKRAELYLLLAEDWRERDSSVFAKYFKEHEFESKKISKPDDIAEIIIKRAFILLNNNQIIRMRVELDSIKRYVLTSKNDFLPAKYFFANSCYYAVKHDENETEHKKIVEALKKSVLVLQKYDITEMAKAQYVLVTFFYNEMMDNNALNVLLDDFLKVTDKLNNPNLQAKFYSQIGLIHGLTTNRASEGLSAYLKALKNYTIMRDSLNIGNTKILIGSKTLSSEYKSDAEKNIFDGIKICERNSFLNPKKADQAISKAYSRLGSYYSSEKQKDKSLNYYRKAIYYNNKAGKFYNEPLIMGNMGLAYTKFEMLDSALIIQKKALDLRKKFGNKEGVLFSYGSIAEIWYNKNEYDSSIAYANKALDLANKTKRHIYDNNAYGSLFRSYEKLNNYERANYYLNRYHTWVDSVNELRKGKEIEKMIAAQKEELAKLEFDKKHAVDKAEIEKNQLLIDRGLKELLILEQENDIKAYSLEQAKTKLHQNKLETEYHEKEIDFLTAEKRLKAAEAQKKEAAIKQQRTVIYAVSFGGCVVLILLIMAVRGYKQKQKDNKVIEQQKSEVESQKHLVEEKNKEILDSISYAKRLQDAILPPANFVNTHLPENFIFYRPKDIVAGDFYWMETLPVQSTDELILIAAADSTGHGVPGALVSLVCSNALNRSVKEFQLTEPGKILNKTRELVLETFAKSTNDVKDGMDISLLSIHKQTNKNTITVRWSGANNPLWYIENNTFVEIKANKQPIGKTDKPVDFITHEISCVKGTIFYLFTDGFPDQFGGPKGKKFKHKQMHEYLLSISNENCIKQVTLLEQKFNDWRGDLEQVDDVCIIGIRI